MMANDTISIAAMQKYVFGRKVVCADGEEGRLAFVVVDGTTWRLQRLGIQRRSFLFSWKTFVVPVSAVKDVTSEGITLHIPSEELVSLQERPRAVVLDEKSIVRNTAMGNQGTLSLVAVDPHSFELAYLVVRNLRAGQDTLLPRSIIEQVTEEAVVVNISEPKLQILPPYRSDRVLQQEVEAILFDVTPLHVDLQGMNIRVQDSVLYLDGNVSSTLRGELVADQAVGVEGLLEVKNRLVGDDQLASDLAYALGKDKRTSGLAIGVYPRLGVVRLSGAVTNEEQRTAAEEITRSFPGVRSVDNDLVLTSKVDALNVLTSAAGTGVKEVVSEKYIRHTK